MAFHSECATVNCLSTCSQKKFHSVCQLHSCLAFSAESGRGKEEKETEEKKESEFSMLSTVDMYAACFAVTSVDSTGAAEDKQNHMLSFY